MRPDNKRNQQHLDNPVAGDYWSERTCFYHVVLKALPDGGVIIAERDPIIKDGQAPNLSRPRTLTKAQHAELVRYKDIDGFVADVFTGNPTTLGWVEQWQRMNTQDTAVDKVMMPHYGMPPKVVASNVRVDLVKDKVEMCFYQYLPIKLAGALESFAIPPQLKWIERFIPYISFDPHTDFIYASVKHLYVTPDNMGNRPGWHTDGFGSDDVNYVWCDKFPTEFAVQPYVLTEDHETSLREMEEQTRPECIVTYGENTMVELNKWNVHRPPLSGEGFRTFMKISVSKNRYNLQGNSHNYMLDYNWDMVTRGDLRNHPTTEVTMMMT